MLAIYAAAAAVVFAIVLWLIYIRHKLTLLKKDVEVQIVRINLQMRNRFEVLCGVFELLKPCAPVEMNALAQKVEDGRNSMAGACTPDVMQKKQQLFCDAFSQLLQLAPRFAPLRQTSAYCSAMQAIETYEKLLCTQWLLYNDSVTVYNRELLRFPVRPAARLLGFAPAAHLEDETDRFIR